MFSLWLVINNLTFDNKNYSHEKITSKNLNNNQTEDITHGHAESRKLLFHKTRKWTPKA